MATPISARNAVVTCGSFRQCAKPVARAGICGCSTRKTRKGIKVVLYAVRSMSILPILSFSPPCLWCRRRCRIRLKWFFALGAEGLSLFTKKGLLAVGAGTKDSCPAARASGRMAYFIIKGVIVWVFTWGIWAYSNKFLLPGHGKSPEKMIIDKFQTQVGFTLIEEAFQWKCLGKF